MLQGCNYLFSRNVCVYFYKQGNDLKRSTMREDTMFLKFIKAQYRSVKPGVQTSAWAALQPLLHSMT